ncbi:MAG: hypothetical protein JRH10_21050, partial [Deltaproteobacteria bacterium]|nr:hypothetical protein [Deltaproteobacteria bacterium]
MAAGSAIQAPRDSPRSASTTALTATALAVLAALALLHASWLYAPCDDAYIFLVYVKNLLAGHGLTFNGARVEGFTSVSWVALLTLLGTTGLPLPPVAESMSAVFGVVCLLAPYWLGRRVGLGPGYAVLPVGLLAASGDFAFYMGVGVETSL